jgi:hypothetical protein
MANCVDAAIKTMDLPFLDAAFKRGTPKSTRRYLAPRNHSMLAGGQLGQLMIGQGGFCTHVTP